MNDFTVIKEVERFYRIIALKPFRRTPGVYFDFVPREALARIDAIDRVIHQQAAISPGPVAGVERPWYMHPHQDDNLVVLYGTRYVDIYTPGHARVESFIVSPNRIESNGEIIYDGPAMLVWPHHVFHRIVSGPEGSASINFAVHNEGFDPRTNFNIHALDTETGDFRVIREGFHDQM